MLPEVECAEVGGVWLVTQLCDPNPCPQPFGACCFSDGHCEYLREVDCPGQWLGYDTVCDPNPCTQVFGACCYPDGHCEYVQQASCAGTWTASQVCEPNPCPPPVGACCYPDGHCEYVLQSECQGVFQSPLAPCEPNPCSTGGSDPVNTKTTTWGGIKALYR